MGFFITEKETEAWLEEETRTLTLPDGTVKPFTGFKLLWRSFDYILETSTFTEKRLIELAQLSSRETGRSFGQSFHDLLAYTHRLLRKRQGVD